MPTNARLIAVFSPVLTLCGLCACSGEIAPSARPVPTPPVPTPAASLTPSVEAPDSGQSIDDAGATDSVAKGPCPEDMVLVDTTYCPDADLEIKCLRSQYDKPNHITICHEFSTAPQRCKKPPRKERFCIDPYEYPNKKGAHPPVMVSWNDGTAACGKLGKRLCKEAEWVSACEGPDKLPFPYGHKRDPEKCNIDNPWIKPELTKVYSTDPAVSQAELARLDQSVPSGAKPGCVSGFGVHDLTGNVDEWVTAEAPHRISRQAGLKGGAWGHVRNACRPMTTSHPPEFTYYFISFRCCKDAE